MCFAFNLLQGPFSVLLGLKFEEFGLFLGLLGLLSSLGHKPLRLLLSLLRLTCSKFFGLGELLLRCRDLLGLADSNLDLRLFGDRHGCPFFSSFDPGIFLGSTVVCEDSLFALLHESVGANRYTVHVEVGVLVGLDSSIAFEDHTAKVFNLGSSLVKEFVEVKVFLADFIYHLGKVLSEIRLESESGRGHRGASSAVVAVRHRHIVRRRRVHRL